MCEKMKQAEISLRGGLANGTQGDRAAGTRHGHGFVSRAQRQVGLSVTSACSSSPQVLKLF